MDDILYDFTNAVEKERIYYENNPLNQNWENDIDQYILKLQQNILEMEKEYKDKIKKQDEEYYLECYEKKVNEIHHVYTQRSQDIIKSQEAAINKDKNQNLEVVNQITRQVNKNNALIANKTTSNLQTFKYLEFAVYLLDLEQISKEEGPFLEELNRIALHVADNKELSSLIKTIPTSAAREGVKTLPHLHDHFRDLKRNVAATVDQEGFWRVVKKYLKNLVIAPPDGLVSGSDPASVLSRVDDHLQKGSLEIAIKELKQLKEPASKVFSGWLEEAQTRHDLNKTIDILWEHAIQFNKTNEK